ncbi:hypothetical protein ACN42_g9713 [Penicillium freii]|uniref:Uncharacterized protein n=1 Tax=Penicillium freii TaxID=48697 RepID=A0A101MBC1_PENFR|nr:hypothetical protein ACN42_g9713 [Penicillium freii]
MFWVDFCERDESKPVPRSSPPQKPASSNELDPPGSMHLEVQPPLISSFFITCEIPRRDRETQREGGKVDGGVPISARTKPKGHIQHIQHNQHDHIDHHQHNQHNQELSSPTDAMILDDTKHTTYIHNLDQELMEADSPGLVFSPFVQKVLSVPQSVLSDSKPSGKELVLYTEPSSLTVPKEKDNVRRAILESRARARENKVPEDLYDDPMDIDS